MPASVAVTCPSLIAHIMSRMDAAYTVESRMSGYHHSCSTCPAHSEVIPTITQMLKTAEPTIVPTPCSPGARNTVMIDVKSSGAEEPAAMKVAPATSSESESADEIRSSDSQKYSSHTIARPKNVYRMRPKYRGTNERVSYSVVHSSLPRIVPSSVRSSRRRALACVPGCGAMGSSHVAAAAATNPAARRAPATKSTERRDARLAAIPAPVILADSRVVPAARRCEMQIQI